MTYQFKDIAGDNASVRRSATNRTADLLAHRLRVLIAMQFRKSPDNAPPVRATANPTLVLLALCLGVLVAQIDTSVVNLATHAIGVTFQAGVAPLQWVLDAYNLVYAVLLLSGGLIADLFAGRDRPRRGAAAALLARHHSRGLARTCRARPHAGNLGQLQWPRFRHWPEHRRFADRAFRLAQRVPAGGAAGFRRICAGLAVGAGIRRSRRPAF